MTRSQDLARRLVESDGRTFAQEAGIQLSDEPSPLYRLLVLTVLLSKPLSSDLAVGGARELSRAGFTTPETMRAATWQQRVDALGRGHYRRFDESTATILDDGAALVLDRWAGDLRRLRDEAEGDAARIADCHSARVSSSRGTAGRTSPSAAIQWRGRRPDWDFIL